MWLCIVSYVIAWVMASCTFAFILNLWNLCGRQACKFAHWSRGATALAWADGPAVELYLLLIAFSWNNMHGRWYVCHWALLYLKMHIFRGGSSDFCHYLFSKLGHAPLNSPWKKNYFRGFFAMKSQGGFIKIVIGQSNFSLVFKFFISVQSLSVVSCASF